MARYSNNPDEVESLRSITIDFFKKNGIVKSNTFKSGTIIWSNNRFGTKNTIGYSLNTDENSGVLTLFYTHNDLHKINYTIQLITRKSNLGFGLLWFFVCPKTNKVCRKLHLNNGYFFHRTAFKSLFYEQQIQSKRSRIMYAKPFIDAFRDDLYFDMRKKYLKKTYKGRFTKTYCRLLLRKRKSERVNLNILNEWL